MRYPVKRSIKRAAFALERGLCTLLQRPQQYVFILGHMRSGSTLLSHLLLSHRDITGYGESNLVYRDRGDLAQLVWTTHRLRRQLAPRRHVIDQVNHNYMVEDQRLLLAPDVRVIFLVRSPLAAITSLIHSIEGPVGEPAGAAGYYAERLGCLIDYADMLPAGRSMLVRYEALVAEPAPVLDKLTRFLALDSALSPNYRQFDFTGQRGDRSDNIRAGRVIETPRRAPPAIDATSLAKLEALRSQLLQRFGESSVNPERFDNPDTGRSADT